MTAYAISPFPLAQTILNELDIIKNVSLWRMARCNNSCSTLGAISHNRSDAY